MTKKSILLILSILALVSSADANQLVRQSTGITITIGPILGKYSEEPLTGLDLAGLDYASIHKPNGGSVVNLAARTWTDRGNGMYDLTLSTSDVDTIGLSKVVLIGDDFYPQEIFLDVVTANKWDADHGVAYLQTNAVQVASATPPANFSSLAINGSGQVTASSVAGNVTGSVGSVTGNVGGSVASVISGVTVSTNNDKTGYSLSTPPPTASQIAGAVWDEARSSHTTTGTFGQGVASVQGNLTGSVGSVTGNVGGSVASVTGNVGGNVTGSVGSVTGNVGGSVNSVISGVTVSTNNDKTGYSLSTPPPTASQIAGAVWDEARSSHTTTGTFGQGVASVQGNLTGSVGSVVGSVGGSVNSVTSGVTVSTNNDKTGYSLSTPPPTAAQVAGAVWDETRSNHTTSGTYGQGVASVQGNVTGSVASVTGNVGGSVASVTSPSPANLVQINGTAIPGNGTQLALGFQYFFNVLSPDKTMNDVGGGATGSSDWSDTEKREIRYRLGIDGQATEPEASVALDIPSAADIRHEMDTNSLRLSAIAADLDNPDQYKADVSGLSTVTTAQVRTQVNAAIEDYRLDELLSVGLGSQPASSSLFGQLTEAHGTYQRFKSTALELSPAGAGGGSSAADIWGYTIDGYTAEELMRLFSAMLAGAIDMSGTRIYVKSLDGDKDRIIFGSGSNGKRTVISRDVSK